MKPPIEHGEARWRLLKRLVSAGEASAQELLPAVMPPYRDQTTPRLLLASLVTFGVAVISRRDRRGAARYAATDKGRAAVSAATDKGRAAVSAGRTEEVRG